MSKQFEGLPGLRKELAAAGFKLAHNVMASSGNGCNWYAYRRSTIAAPECECNEGKRIQIVVNPSEFELGGHAYQNAEVEVTGEAGGRWYKLTAYGIKAAELIQSLPVIEQSLISAWTALKRDPLPPAPGEQVGEVFGWWFTEDPDVFCMPGSGFRRFPDKPLHTVECIPLYTAPPSTSALVEALEACVELLAFVEPEVRGGYSPDGALSKARAALAAHRKETA